VAGVGGNGGLPDIIGNRSLTGSAKNSITNIRSATAGGEGPSKNPQYGGMSKVGSQSRLAETKKNPGDEALATAVSKMMVSSHNNLTTTSSGLHPSPPKSGGGGLGAPTLEIDRVPSNAHLNVGMSQHNIMSPPPASIPTLRPGSVAAIAQETLKLLGRPRFQLHDFEIRNTLGTGSFGRVHLVKAQVSNKYFAMKVLRKNEIVKLRQVEHTINEKHILTMLDHPFLVGMLGTFQDSNNLYLVLEYVQGGELFSFLRKSGVSISSFSIKVPLICLTTNDFYSGSQIMWHVSMQPKSFPPLNTYTKWTSSTVT
jgi:hypothetical protein